MRLGLNLFNQTAQLEDKLKAAMYKKLYCLSQNHFWVRLTGLGVGIVSSISTVVTKILSIAESVFKGLVNIFGCPFAKSCKFKAGLLHLIIAVAKPCALPFSLLSAGVGLLTKPLLIFVIPKKYLYIKWREHDKHADAVQIPAETRSETEACNLIRDTIPAEDSNNQQEAKISVVQDIEQAEVHHAKPASVEAQIELNNLVSELEFNLETWIPKIAELEKETDFYVRNSGARLLKSTFEGLLARGQEFKNRPWQGEWHISSFKDDPEKFAGLMNQVENICARLNQLLKNLDESGFKAETGNLNTASEPTNPLVSEMEGLATATEKCSLLLKEAEKLAKEPEKRRRERLNEIKTEVKTIAQEHINQILRTNGNKPPLRSINTLKSYLVALVELEESWKSENPFLT